MDQQQQQQQQQLQAVSLPGSPAAPLPPAGAAAGPAALGAGPGPGAAQGAGPGTGVASAADDGPLYGEMWPKYWEPGTLPPAVICSTTAGEAGRVRAGGRGTDLGTPLCYKRWAHPVAC